MSFPTHFSLICCHVQKQPPGVAIGPWLESTQPQPEGSQGLGVGWEGGVSSTTSPVC